MSPLRPPWNLFRRTRLDDDLEQELDTHLALIEEEEQASGSSPERARQAARRRFGSPLSSRERAVESVVPMGLETLRRELVFAARRLWRSPAFTIAGILTLALAIGANASIFAVVSRVVLNPLPYGDPDRIVALNNGMPSRNIPSGFNTITPRLYYHYLDRSRTLTGLAAYRIDEQTLTGRVAPERIRVSRATPSLATVLRVTPASGRWFSDAEGVPGAASVAVLSHRLWLRRFGEDPGVLGSIVRIDGVPTTIVGVMAASFAFPAPDIDVWVPYAITRATATDSFSIGGVGRLASGSTIQTVRTELDGLGADLERQDPGNGYGQVVSTATTLIDATVGHVTVALWVSLGAVALVLFVACANIANLFLIRSEARRREVALRQALGAGGRGVALYFLAESALLALLGSAAGFGVAWGAVRLLVVFGPTSLPRLHEVRLDAETLAFMLVLSAGIAVALACVPLIRFAPLAAALHESGRGHTASRGRHRFRQLLMGGQVGLALVLLVSSGLMLRSFQMLRAVDPGFDAASALSFRVGLPASDYPDRAHVVAAHLDIIERLSKLPGVTAASGTTCLPLAEGCNQGGPIFVEGRMLPRGTNPPIVLRRAVAGGYFAVMGMRLLRGRDIDRGDVDRQEPVVVINEELARVLFPQEDPIGRRVRLGNPALGVPGWLTIAGVVGNTPLLALGQPPVPQVFMPLFATRDVNVPTRLEAMSYVLRAAVPPTSLAAVAQRAVAEVDANLALAQVWTLQDILDRASAQMAFTMVLIAIAATVALLLGVIGIYGVTSYIVRQRTGEIGVRLALGADPKSVTRMIVKQGGMVATIGLAAGLAAALAGSRLIESLLYGISSRDPVVFGVMTLLLLAVSIASCWIPARRAARLTPLDALRTE
jgi:predicted permease